MCALFVLQKGVKNIHLFQNKKYDLRVHVVFVKKNREIIPLLYPIADVRLSPKVYQDQKLNKESNLNLKIYEEVIPIKENTI